MRSSRSRISVLVSLLLLAACSFSSSFQVSAQSNLGLAISHDLISFQERAVTKGNPATSNPTKAPATNITPPITTPTAISVSQSTTVNLQDNQVVAGTVQAGSVVNYYLPLSRNGGTIYLTVSTCSTTNPNEDGTGLQLYYSTSSANQAPGPNAQQSANSVRSSLGYVSVSIPNVSGNLFLGVTSVAGTTGSYNFQLSVSTQKYLHQVSRQKGLYLDDTDSTTAMFHTYTYPIRPNFQAYITTTNIPGNLNNSICAITNLTPLNSTISNLTETSRLGNLSTQFLYPNLPRSTTFMAYLINVVGNNSISSTTGGAAILFPGLKFATKTLSNCRLISNLPFCSQVAYSVPANPSVNTTFIATTYDSMAKQMFQNFSITLSNFNCNSTMYSLVRNCDNCASAYMDWLCAVMIPRCTDVESSDMGILHQNNSRNPAIDQILQPGIYKEVLPCLGLCYNIVQSCPVSLFGFSCPLPMTLPNNYAHMINGQSNGPSGALCNAFSRDKQVALIGSANRTAFSSLLTLLCLLLTLTIWL